MLAGLILSEALLLLSFLALAPLFLALPFLLEFLAMQSLLLFLFDSEFLSLFGQSFVFFLLALHFNLPLLFLFLLKAQLLFEGLGGQLGRALLALLHELEVLGVGVADRRQTGRLLGLVDRTD